MSALACCANCVFNSVPYIPKNAKPALLILDGKSHFCIGRYTGKLTDPQAWVSLNLLGSRTSNNTALQHHTIVPIAAGERTADRMEGVQHFVEMTAACPNASVQTRRVAIGGNELQGVHCMSWLNGSMLTTHMLWQLSNCMSGQDPTIVLIRHRGR